MDKKLYRAREGKVLAGVAAGLADYFDVDPIVVRIVFVVLSLANGLGVLGYIIFLVVMPEEPVSAIDQGENKMDDTQSSQAPGAAPKPDAESLRKRSLVPGVILIGLGLVFLAANFFPELDMGKLWPVILVVIGLALLMQRKR